MGNELDTLYQAFGILRQLKAEEQAALASAVRRWELKPRQYIMQVGDICQYSSCLPEEVRLVKAFGTLGAQSLQEAAYASPRKVLFYASNCPSVCVDIDALIEDAGFAPLYLGGLEHSIRLEVFGALHEFGALGKTVTLEEAKAQL